MHGQRLNVAQRIAILVDHDEAAYAQIVDLGDEVLVWDVLMLDVVPVADEPLERLIV